MNSREFAQKTQSAADIYDQSRGPAFVKHILAPTNLRWDSKKAIDYAVAFARTTGARVTQAAEMPSLENQFL